MFAAQNNAAQVQAGRDLLEISTEAIGFQSIAGETRLRLLPSPWPIDSLPKPTSSLLSIASRQGLVAAVGPDVLILGDIKAVREAFSNKDLPVQDNIKQFNPQLSIPIPRVSQVAFSSDETSLTLCAAEGGGLAIYDVQALKQGNKDSAFQIPTNGIPVRALIPNPAPEFAHLLAVVLEQGQLMIANLKERKFESGGNGMIMKDGVSCVSWSNKGKQLTAGLGNGTAVQMTPAGEIKAEIPKYPQLDGDQHVSGISWLDNDHWLIIYTPSALNSEFAPDSTFLYVGREKNTKNFTFRKAQDPCPPFGMNRAPQHHFITRLRDFPPALTDAIILASTAAGDIGVMACSKMPLSAEPMASETANQYTTITIANDSRKAQLPAFNGVQESSPIGAALDLSSSDRVPRPIPAEEMDSSPTPLPGLAVLNHEGVLSYWWFVYSDSVRQGQGYPGLVAIPESQQRQAETQAPSAVKTTSLGSGAFGRGATPAANPFATSATPAFGSTSSLAPGGGFGSAGGLGQNKSPWATGNTTTQATSSTFGAKSTFGSATSIGGGGGFGSVGGIGARASPWSSATQGQPQTENKPNPFSSGSSAPTGFAAFAQPNADKPQSPFANLASGSSGFAAIGQNSNSPFGGTATSAAPAFGTQPSFGSTMTIGSNLSSNSFGEPKSAWGTPALSNNNSNGFSNATMVRLQEKDMDDDMDSVTSKDKDNAPSNSADNGFGLFSKPNTNAPFKIQSSFKPDKGSIAEEKAKPAGPSLFGGDFGKALGDTEKAPENAPGKAVVASSENKTFDGKIVKAEPKDDTDDAPLPPDPSTYKPTTMPEPAPLPPSPKAQAFVSEPAPLPPSPEPASAVNDSEPPLPPSPKVASAVNDSEPPLPPSPKPQSGQSDEWSPAGSEAIDLGEEGTLHLSPPRSHVPGEADSPEQRSRPEGTPTQRFQTSWDFSSRTPKSPENEREPGSNLTTPMPSFTATPSTIGRTLPSDTPLAVKPPVMFAPPSRVRDSSRSPSPIRGSRLIAGQRSLSSPSPTRGKQQYSTTPKVPPPANWMIPGVRDVSKPSSFGDSARLTPVQESTPQPAPQDTVVDILEVDDSERHIAAELAADLEPTRKLATFLAHSDYVGRLDGSGVASQIEKVYRDINSMIDTLGLNARSLKSWVAGHEDSKNSGRGREDLEVQGLGDWCMQEIQELSVVQKEISEELDADRIEGVREKVTELVDIRRDLLKLEQRNKGIQRTVYMHQHPDEEEEEEEEASSPLASRSRSSRSPSLHSPRKSKSSLTPEQNRLLLELRKSYATTQTQMAKAEGALSVLRAKLASASTSSNGSASAQQMPTVEAVLNTIAKMTRMVETKSGDLDVLEARMRRMKFKTANDGKDLDQVLGGMTIHSRSRETTPLRTPPSTAKKARAAGRFELQYDESDDDNDAFRTPPMNRSVGSNASRRSLVLKDRLSGGVLEEEVQAHALRMSRRRVVLDALNRKVGERGTRLSTVS